MNAQHLRDEIMARWDWDEPHVAFDVEDIHVVAHWVDGTDEDPPELILIGPAEGLMVLAYDAATSWFSEATNNDACEWSIHEKAAHFDDGTPWGHARVSVKILDDLT